jgi:uncharacterized membrane protein YozB (DUF420 family)
MDLLHILPHVNAALNTASGLSLIAGFYFILTRQIARHRASMLSAAILSALFLACYVTHHTLRTSVYGLGPTRFTGEGIARPVYFTILTSHTILATLVAPFVVFTLWRALKGRFDAHRRIARLVYPVWLYVSASGVAVYLMLYQIYPAR